MERLTKRNGDIVYYAKGKYAPKTLCADMEPWEVRECMKKLATYEDTGLEPEEIPTKEVLNEINEKLGKYYFYNSLELQGLLIKLPCKVGNTVYALSYADNKYYPRKVSAIKITSQGFIIEYREKGTVRSRKLECDGVFLTREEAEKHLEGK